LRIPRHPQGTRATGWRIDLDGLNSRSVPDPPACHQPLPDKPSISIADSHPHGDSPGLTDSTLPTVTILVPTLALAERRERLLRALASIRSQEGVMVRACVVVNGSEADPALVDELHRQPQVEVIRIAERGIPAAFRAGRDRVATTYFGGLDDDDILLPGALAARIAVLRGPEQPDAVVTDGLIRSASGDRRRRRDFAAVASDPATEMLRENWLLPGAWLCRSDRVGAWLFQGMPPFRECTWLGLRLATRARLAFLPTPTVIYHENSPGGAHRTLAYCLAQPAAIRQFMALPLSPGVLAAIRASMAGVCHEIADRLLFDEGQRLAAWQWHLRSLVAPGGYRHLLFTRKLWWPRRWLAAVVR